MPAKPPPAATPPPRPALTLHLQGTARVALADGRAVVLEPRAAGLCALAALAPGTPRERAAAWLWPNSDDPRRNLRQQLLRFRKQFGHALVAGGAQLALGAGVALAGGEGELLAGQADGEDDFGAWLAGQRTLQAAARHSAWQRELAAAEAEGELDRALAVAEGAVRTDPDSEDAWHALMRVHYLRGQATPGLAAYAQALRVLAAHGREPSAATRQLADALLQGSRSRAAPAQPPAPALALPVTLKRPPRLAGRGDELAAARRAWAAGRAVLLAGEAGLGKSRLVQELVATSEGQALVGAGRPGDAGAPYATLSRWLAPLLLADNAPGALTAPQQQALAHLPPAAPRPCGGAPALPASAALPGRAPLQRGALEAALAALLDRHRITRVVLDDLHFADAATLELAAALASADHPTRRWLFAMRPVEAPPAALALRDDLAELQRLEVVRLAPLGEAAAAELVDTLALPGLTGRTLAPALVRHTGGNPLYLLETLKQGLQDGSLARGQLPRTAQVGALIDRRLQRLSEPAITLARVAAIAGVDFSIELAEAATGQRAVQLASAWQELSDAQVLRDEGFAHDLVADAALRSVPPVVARRVHAQCAQWLAAQGVEPARVAWHWRRGGKPAEAGHAFMAAAQRAERAARLREEAEFYGLADQAFADAGMDAQAFDARLLRVRALNGIAFDDQALHEAHALLAGAATDTQRMLAHTELCGLHTERSEPQAALDAGQAAMALARALAHMACQVRIACHLATTLCRLGRGDEALAVLAPQRAWVLQQPDPVLRMLWHGDWASALGAVGRLRDAIAAYDVALAAAREYGAPDAEGRLLMNCAVTLRNAGQLDRSLAMARQGHALSLPEPGQAEALPIGRLVVARDAAETGLYADALPELEATLAEFERRHAGFWVQAARLVLARMWLDLGQFARALGLLGDEADALPAWLRADRRLLRLDLATALQSPPPAGLLDQALALAAQDVVRGPALQVRALRHQAAAAVRAQAGPLGKALRAGERHGAWMTLQVHSARAALAVGDRSAAAEAAWAVLGAFDEGIAPEGMYRAEAWWVAHQALVAHGDMDAADRALRAAEQWLRQVALPQVPAAFLDSFLHRNAANRALLAALAAAARGPSR